MNALIFLVPEDIVDVRARLVRHYFCLQWIDNPHNMRRSWRFSEVWWLLHKNIFSLPVKICWWIDSEWNLKYICWVYLYFRISNYGCRFLLECFPDNTAWLWSIWWSWHSWCQQLNNCSFIEVEDYGWNGILYEMVLSRGAGQSRSTRMQKTGSARGWRYQYLATGRGAYYPTYRTNIFFGNVQSISTAFWILGPKFKSALSPYLLLPSRFP